MTYCVSTSNGNCDVVSATNSSFGSFNFSIPVPQGEVYPINSRSHWDYLDILLVIFYMPLQPIFLIHRA